LLPALNFHASAEIALVLSLVAVDNDLNVLKFNVFIKETTTTDSGASEREARQRSTMGKEN